MRFITTLLLLMLVGAVHGGGLAVAEASFDRAEKASFAGAETVLAAAADLNGAQPADRMVSASDPVGVSTMDARTAQGGSAPCFADCPWLPSLTDHGSPAPLASQTAVHGPGFYEHLGSAKPRPPRI